MRRKECEIKVILCPFCGGQNLVAPWEVDFDAAALEFVVSASCQDCKNRIVLTYTLFKVDAYLVRDVESVSVVRRFEVLE